jgi:tRNA threonylcarbamoyl adenosine modification protein YeaZ
VAISRDILTLAIETSNPSLVADLAPTPGQHAAGPGVAVGHASDGSVRVLAWRPLQRAHPNEDPLAGLIEACVREAGVRPSDLKRVAVSIGPGGFTSVRVAVTTAKLIAEATGAACIGVPSAQVAAWEAAASAPGDESSEGEAPVAIALASKGESAWVAVYGPDFALRAEPRVMISADMVALVGLGVRRLVHDAFLPASMAAAAAAAGLRSEPVRLSARGVLALSGAAGAVDPAILTPIYPREPEAVTKWRAMGR